MSRMSWSEELKKFAVLMIRQCDPSMHPCMSSPEFTNIGSIYDGLSYSGAYKPAIVPVLTEELINGWFEDTRFVTRKLLLQLSADFQIKTVRRALLLMTDRNSHVGCSAATFMNSFSNQFSLVCTFATDNMNELPIYKITSSPGKQCKRRDKTYTNLCAVGEDYNNNHEYQEGELLQIPEDVITVY